MKRKKIPLNDVSEKGTKRTTTVTFGIETDNLELYRRAAFDTGASSLAAVLRASIDIGFPIFCREQGIIPSVPKKRELTEEEEKNRQAVLEKRLQNLKYYKKVKGEGN